MPRPRISLLLGGAVILACVAGGGLRGNEPPTDAPHRVALISSGAEEKRAAMFVMDEDGSHRAALPQREGESVVDAVLSPDGLQVAFTTFDTATFNLTIHVMNVDGAGRKTVAGGGKGESAFSPAWSPDGKRIAYTFCRGNGSGFGLFVADRDGRNAVRVGAGYLPDWSPDGRQLLFTKEERGGVWSLWVLDLQTRKPRRLVEAPSLMGVWSPDGKRIAYLAGDAVKPDLFTMAADGSDRRQLTKTEEAEVSPRWSADGRRLLFSRGSLDGDKRPFQVYSINVDGADEKQLGKGEALLGGFGFISWIMVTHS